jgi:hypothetical protein
MEVLSHLPKNHGPNASIFVHLPGFARPFNISQSGALFTNYQGLLEQLLPLKDGVSRFTFGLSLTQAIVLIVCIAWGIGPLVETPPAVTNAVYHGYRSWLEPTLLLRGRFILNSKALIASGSLKVHLTSISTRPF